jgi:hypothetical protein
MLNVALDIVSVTPDVNVTVGTVMSEADVPTEQWNETAAPLVRISAHATVPLVPITPEVTAFAVAVPLEEAPNAVAPNVCVQSSVLPECAVFAVAGCVPL